MVKRHSCSPLVEGILLYGEVLVTLPTNQDQSGWRPQPRGYSPPLAVTSSPAIAVYPPGRTGLIAAIIPVGTGW